MSEEERNRGKRRRRRKRGRRGGEPDRGTPEPGSEHRQGAAETRDGDRPKRRKKRRRKGASSASASAPREAVPAEALDDGWDLPEALDPSGPGARAATEPPLPLEAYGDDEAGLDSMSTQIPWGDDADAPTPEIELGADLPPNPPPDDPDPASAHLESAEEPGDPGELAGGPAIRNIVAIKFHSAGKIYLYDGGEGVYRRGEEVVVETDRGPRVGEVAAASVRRAQPRAALKRILRRPSKSDRRQVERNEERGRETLLLAKEKARDLGLDIKVFRAQHALTGNKVQVYFSAEGKVDSRPLARALAQSLHCRVDMRQTGVRDEAKLVGGIGSCGQELCCTTWLPSFVPVSIKNAKDQGLVLNPAKVSGQCGRLKCCLVYEQETYAELRKGLPKLGKQVVTEAGEGRVVEVDVLRQRIRVRLTEGDFQVFSPGEVEAKYPSQKQRREKT